MNEFRVSRFKARASFIRFEAKLFPPRSRDSYTRGVNFIGYYFLGVR